MTGLHANLLDIEPVKLTEHNCIDDTIASIAKWMGRRHEMMYACAWNFGFQSQGRGCLGERLRVPPSEFRDCLERYHGLRSTVIRTETPEQGLDLILQELTKGIPAFITLDLFWVPWDEQHYQKENVVHTLIITGYDPASRDLYCTDPYFQKKGVRLPYDHYLASYMHVTTLEVIGKEMDDWPAIAKSLLEDLKQTIGSGRAFGQMAEFAEAILNFDLALEVGNASHFGEVRLFDQLVDVAEGRVKYTQLLMLAAEKFDPGLRSMAERMQKIAAIWGVIRGSMIKMFVTRQVMPALLQKVADRVRQAAAEEQNLLESLVVLLEKAHNPNNP